VQVSVKPGDAQVDSAAFGGTDAAGEGSYQGDLRPYRSGACLGWIDDVESRAR
jgi:hypothetical protein